MSYLKKYIYRHDEEEPNYKENKKNSEKGKFGNKRRFNKKIKYILQRR